MIRCDAEPKEGAAYREMRPAVTELLSFGLGMAVAVGLVKGLFWYAETAKLMEVYASRPEDFGPVIVGAVGAVFAIGLAVHAVALPWVRSWVDGSASRGRPTEEKRVGAALRDTGAWGEVLEDGEELLGGVLVDEPEARQPKVLKAVGLGLHLFAGLAGVVAIASFLTAGEPFIEGYLIITYGLVPLLGFMVAAAVPRDVELWTTAVGVGGLTVWAATVTSGTTPWSMGGDGAFAAAPEVLVGGGLALALCIWLAGRIWTRPYRLLLVTSRGLRLAALRGGAERTVGEVRRPSTLTVAPGSFSRRWLLGEDGDVLDVRPLADDPADFLAACREAGLELEERRRPGRYALGTEVRDLGPGVLVLVALLVANLGMWTYWVDLGLHLGLLVIPEIATSMESRAGAEKMIAHCQRTLQRHPEELASLSFLALMQHTKGDFAAARGTLARFDEVVAGMRFPALLKKGQTTRLMEAIREDLEGAAPVERGAVPPHWAPPGVDGVRFWHILDRVLELRDHLWVSHWPEDAAELLEIAERHPDSAGPAWVGALLAYGLSDEDEMRAFLVGAGVDPATLPPKEDPTGKPVGGGTALELLGQVTQALGGAGDRVPPVAEVLMAASIRDVVRPRLEALEELPAWRGSAAQLGNGLPASAENSLDDFLGAYENPEELDRKDPRVRKVLEALQGEASGPTVRLVDGGDPALRALALTPPANLGGLVEIAPALEDSASGHLRELIDLLLRAPQEGPLENPRIRELWPRNAF